MAAAIVALIVALTACTSDTGSDSSTSIAAGGRTAVDGLVALCESALAADPPDIERLALDPSVTGQIVSIPDDLVATASQEFFDCLGAERAASYLTSDFIVTGVALPADTAACLVPALQADGATILEVSLRRIRLEEQAEELTDTFIEAFLDCVPGRFLAAALRSVSPFGYAASVDEACLDEAQVSDDAAMRVFWRLQLASTGSNDPERLTDDETAIIVEPLYTCIDTGTFIAADPTTGASLSDSSRACISDAAESHGYWESRIAAKDFDQAGYEGEISGCLNPEEAQFILGTPIPADDPVASNFAAVDTCWAERADANGRDLLAAAAQLDDAALTALATELADCAGADGVAGRIASTTYGTRGLPAGSYACLQPVAAGDPASVLAGRLFVEAGRIPAQTPGAAYRDAALACIPIGIASRSLFADFNGRGVVDSIDFACIDTEFAAAPTAKEAYWQGTVFGGFSTDTTPTSSNPTDLARAAVAPLYECVDAGRGFASLAASSGVGLSVDTIVCITESTTALGLLELRIAALEPAEDAFNAAIAACLTAEEIEAFQP